jgi:hypothetical protein
VVQLKEVALKAQKQNQNQNLRVERAKNLDQKLRVMTLTIAADG